MSTKRISFLALVILLVLISLFSCNHFRIYCILSGSMEPTISTGSLILVDTDVSLQLHMEDIVTFTKQDSIITHRIVKQINDQKFITKGDANNNDDPTPLYKSQIIGKVILTIPYIGYIVLFIRRYLWLLCIAFLAWQIIQKKEKERFMAKCMKGISYLSAFEAIEQIKNAKNEEEKKRLIQMEIERRKKNRHRTNVIIVAGLIINLVTIPMLFLRIKQRVFDILIPDYSVSIIVFGSIICMTALTAFFLNGLIKLNRVDFTNKSIYNFLHENKNRKYKKNT